MTEKVPQPMIRKTGLGVQLRYPLLAVPRIVQVCSFEVEGIALYKTGIGRTATGDARCPCQGNPGVTCNVGTNFYTKL